MTDDPTAPASRAGADRALAPASALQRLVSLILSRYATLLIWSC